MNSIEGADYDPRCILVVNDKGQLRQLFVVFCVRCQTALENIPVGSLVYVEGVHFHRKYILLYWINQRLYPYYHFSFHIVW